MNMVRKGDKRINALSLGVAGGILGGAIILLTTLAGLLFGGFPEFLSLIADIYGFGAYDVTWFGVILGGIYGFIDCFIFFWLLGLLYNRL